MADEKDTPSEGKDDTFDLTPVDANGNPIEGEWIDLDEREPYLIDDLVASADADAPGKPTAAPPPSPEEPDIVTAPAVQAGFRVIEGGKSTSGRSGPNAGDRPSDETGRPTYHSVASLPVDDFVLDPEYRDRDFPPIEVPENVLDLQLTPAMYPQGLFLRDFLRWVAASTDAPPAFALGAALSVLAVAAGRNWRVQDQCTGGLTPNLYILLLGESGSRKSAVLKTAVELTAAAQRWHGSFESTLAFMLRLEAFPTQLWLLDEGVTLFDALQNPATLGIGPRLTGAYDGSAIRWESKASQATVENPCLSILAGSTVDWLRDKQLSADVLRGGIFGRFFLLPSPNGTPRLEARPFDSKTKENFERWLSELSQCKNPKTDDGHYLLDFTHEAKQELYSWIAWTFRAAKGGQAMSTGIWNRAGSSVKKIALLYHLAENRGNTAIQADSVKQAIAFFHHYLLPAHIWATRGLVQRTGFDAFLSKLEDALLAEPEGVPFKDAAVRLGLSVAKANEVVYALFAAGRLTVWAWMPSGREGLGRPVYILSRGRPTRHGRLTAVDEAGGLPKALQRLHAQETDLDADFWNTVRLNQEE